MFTQTSLPTQRFSSCLNRHTTEAIGSSDSLLFLSFEIGINRLENVVRYAKEKSVKIAFENINSPEYLFRVLNNFNTPDVGFCYDCGHEACHTPGVRYLPIIGNRLMCTHIHDNDNESDLHLIPFDGEIDFQQMCNELKAINYKGNITLELCYSDKYKAELSDYEFLKKCYESAEKIRTYNIRKLFGIYYAGNL